MGLWHWQRWWSPTAPWWSSRWYSSSTQVSSSTGMSSPTGESSSARESSSTGESSSWLVVLRKSDGWQFWQSFWSPAWWIGLVWFLCPSQGCFVGFCAVYSMSCLWVNFSHQFSSKVGSFLRHHFYRFGYRSHLWWVNADGLS